jgi:general nucleoside transport system permease protein
MMDWDTIFQWGFVIALLTAGIRLAVPVLLAVLGEIITERAGVLNLGLEGIMAVGGLAGFGAAYFLEQGLLAGGSTYPSYLMYNYPLYIQ